MPKNSTSQATTATSSSSSTTSEEDLEAKAASLLAEAQANPTSEAVTNAQAAINKLSDESKNRFTITIGCCLC